MDSLRFNVRTVRLERTCPGNAVTALLPLARAPLAPLQIARRLPIWSNRQDQKFFWRSGETNFEIYLSRVSSPSHSGVSESPKVDGEASMITSPWHSPAMFVLF